MGDARSSKQVDQTALKVNQAAIIALLLLAFLANSIWLVAFVAAVMLVGTVRPDAGLFKLVYAWVLRPTGLLKPQVIADDPQPHLFAQGLGGLMLVAALVSWFVGLPMLTWLLTLIVVVLAGVNLVAGFCLGCFIYYQLAQRGIHANLPQWQPAAVKHSTRGNRQ